MYQVGELIEDAVSRGWANFVARPSGPLNLRFVIQPALATLIAARAGWKDARAGRPAYLWAVFSQPSHRGELLRGGLIEMRTPFLVASALDAVYQLVIQRTIHPLELLLTATLLALVPYFLLRGPIGRLAAVYQRSRAARSTGAQPGSGTLRVDVPRDSERQER